MATAVLSLLMLTACKSNTNEVTEASITSETTTSRTETEKVTAASQTETGSEFIYETNSNKELLNNLFEHLHNNYANLLLWNYDDYDSNGINEAFAVTKEDDHLNHLWFVNYDNVIDLGNVSYDTIFVFAVSDIKNIFV